MAAAVSERRVRSASSTSFRAGPGSCIKSFVFLYIFIWVRATLPRYRYDQLMRLGWKVLIPAGDRQPRRDRHREGVAVVMGEAIAFYVISAFILGFARAGRHHEEHRARVLFLVLDFLFVAALYVLLDGAVPRGHPDAGLRRRHRRAVPVRRHAGEPEAAAGRRIRRSAAPAEARVRRCRRRCSRELGAILVWGSVAACRSIRTTMQNTRPGDQQHRADRHGCSTPSYLIPFEIASMLLLVAMIGAIILAKREL